MSLPYLIADVFTDTALAGNPLAVFPDAQSLSAETMQKIAVEMHLSETIFVLPPEEAAHTARVRIFTPAQELGFAGHPTVGVAIALASLGRIPTPEGESMLVLEEGVRPGSGPADGARWPSGFGPADRSRGAELSRRPRPSLKSPR